MLTVPSRRGFLGGLGALIVAPSIVRADSLMKMGMHEKIRRYVPMLMGHNEWATDGKWLREITECWMWDRFEDRVAWIKMAPSDSTLAQEWRTALDARRYGSPWIKTEGAVTRMAGAAPHVRLPGGGFYSGPNPREFATYKSLPLGPHKHPTGADWPWNAAA